MSMDDKENALIFDTHAHYDDEAFDKDRESVIASLPAGGIGTAVDVASTAASIPIVVRIAEEHEHLLAAVGVHPSECAEMSQKDMDLIEEMLKHPKVKAIGEIGLDYHWPEPERSIQKKWFSRQLDLALKTDMPVIIHSRDAAEDTYLCLREFCRKRKDAGLSGSPGVIHCYSYSPEQAREYVKMGFYIGIGGALTFKNSKKLRTVAQETPLANIVLETDCPYMAPVQHRGERNSSLFLPFVAEELSVIKGMDKEEIIRQTASNARKLYRLDGSV